MIRLYDNETDADLGSITEEQLEVLVEELVEDSLDESIYNITPAGIASLEAHGAGPELIALLRRALGTRVSMELRHEPD